MNVVKYFGTYFIDQERMKGGAYLGRLWIQNVYLKEMSKYFFLCAIDSVDKWVEVFAGL